MIWCLEAKFIYKADIGVVMASLFRKQGIRGNIRNFWFKVNVFHL